MGLGLAAAAAQEVADRTVINTNEQHVFFVCLLWMHAVFVDAQTAGALGLVAALPTS